MNPDKRNIVTRFFSAQEIVRSNDENVGPNDQSNDGRTSSQYGQYGVLNNAQLFSPNQLSSDPGNFGGPSVQDGQYARYNQSGPVRRPPHEILSNIPNIFGGQSNRYDQYGFGGPNNIQSFGASSIPDGQYAEHYNNNIGGPVRRPHLNIFGGHDQHGGPSNTQPFGPSSYTANFGGPSMQDARYTHNIGGPVRLPPHAFRSNNPNDPDIYGGHNRDNWNRNNQRDDFNNNDAGRGSHPNDIRQYVPSNQPNNGVTSYNNHESVDASNERLIDATSKIEHAKLKAKIVAAYKRKPFSENSARFDEDEWLNVWYIFSNGLRSYQCKMICPLCFKNLTPQNRSSAGNVPLWDFTIVRGHLERLHSPQKANKQADNGGDTKKKSGEEGQVSKEEKTEKTNEKNEPIKNDKDGQITYEEEEKTHDEDEPTNEKEEQKKIQVQETTEKSTAAEPLDIVSSPESLSRSTSSSSSSSSEAEESSSSSDDTTEIPEWQQPGMEFGWVKFTTSSRFVPAFIFPLEKNSKKRKAKQILSNGGGKLAEKKHYIDVVANAAQIEQAKKSKKTKPYLAALKQFNLNNKTKFQ